LAGDELQQLKLRVERGGRNDEPVAFDELGRDTQLLGLLRLISRRRTSPPLVIGVHGDWGEGKTSFMRVLQVLLSKAGRTKYHELEVADATLPEPPLSQRAAAVLKEEESAGDDIPSVWFNPWEHQFEDEPVMPLLDAVRIQQSSAWSKLTSRIKRVVEDPKFRIMGKAALGVAKMVGPGWFTALSRQIGDEARQVLDSFADFRDEFEACMEHLTRDRGGRMVIFIDDLDRCESEYVVKILEALKLHLLNRHCVFVLGCAEQRVRKCLEKKLGLDGHEAGEYVEKIVQLPVHLPHVWDRNFDGLLRQLGWPQFTSQTDARCFDLLRTFAADNPRRLKRFLHWYDMERSMVESVPELAQRADAFFSRAAVFLKIKLLQFAAPRRFIIPSHFERDIEPQAVADEREQTRGPDVIWGPETHGAQMRRM
jgi:hypothetical protein